MQFWPGETYVRCRLFTNSTPRVAPHDLAAVNPRRIRTLLAMGLPRPAAGRQLSAPGTPNRRLDTPARPPGTVSLTSVRPAAPAEKKKKKKKKKAKMAPQRSSKRAQRGPPAPQVVTDRVRPAEQARPGRGRCGRGLGFPIAAWPTASHWIAEPPHASGVGQAGALGLAPAAPPEPRSPASGRGGRLRQQAARGHPGPVRQEEPEIVSVAVASRPGRYCKPSQTGQTGQPACRVRRPKAAPRRQRPGSRTRRPGSRLRWDGPGLRHRRRCRHRRDGGTTAGGPAAGGSATSSPTARTRGWWSTWPRTSHPPSRPASTCHPRP